MARTGRWISLGIATVLVLLGLGLLGGVLSPAWSPPPAARYPAYQSLPPGPSPTGATTTPTRQEDTSISVSGTTLRATILSPTTPGRHPAIVLVAGGGPATRVGLRDEAEYLAHAGIVTMRYDKRSVGYSFTHRDYGQLADDARSAVQLLRQRSDVDPARVGLWGISEGGWVVPIAAARSSDVAFAILVSAPSISPLRQLAWSADTELARLHAPIGARQTMARAIGMGGFDYVGYDPVPALSQVRQPVLAIYGARDKAVPPAESADRLAAAFDRGGNRSYTIRFFADADHAMRRPDGALAPGYLQLMAAWVTGLPDTAHPGPGLQVAGATPVQERTTTDTPSPPWYGTGTALAIAFGLALVATLAGPLLALVARLRRQGARVGAGATDNEPATTNEPAASNGTAAAQPVRSRLRRLALFAIGLAVMLNLFIAVLVASALGAFGSALLLHGSWLAVRLVATVTVVLFVSTISSALPIDGGIFRRTTAVARVSWWGVVLGAGLVLIIAAYWGVFAPSW